MSTESKAVFMETTGEIDTPGIFLDGNHHVEEPRGRDLLVEVRAVSVNPIDTKIRRGLAKTGGHKILGFDAAGVVKAVGAHTNYFDVGDHVYYAGQMDRPGSNSAFQLVDERIVGHKPKNATFAQAAAVPLTALTAWEGLFDKLRLRSDSAGTLLVIGGAGGVGSMVIQLAKALTEVRVVASASTSESSRWARDMGADAIVNHGDHEGLEDAIRRAAPAGVDYVFSTHSAGLTKIFASVMNTFGQIVAIDDGRDVDLLALKGKSLSWHWESMFARSIHGALDVSTQHRILDSVAGLIDARAVRSTMRTVLGSVDARSIREAHRRVEEGHSIGKLVLIRDDVPALGLMPRGWRPENI